MNRCRVHEPKQTLFGDSDPTEPVCTCPRWICPECKKITVGVAEARAALDHDRQRWAAEKAVSRPCTADAMRWVLEQADNDYAIAEKFLTAWDLCASSGMALDPYWLIGQMERQRRITRQILTTTPITFDPAHKISFATSHMPHDDQGIWRRFIDLPRHMLGDTFSVTPSYTVPLRISSMPVRLAMYLALEWVP